MRREVALMGANRLVGVVAEGDAPEETAAAAGASEGPATEGASKSTSDVQPHKEVGMCDQVCLGVRFADFATVPTSAVCDP